MQTNIKSNIENNISILYEVLINIKTKLLKYSNNLDVKFKLTDEIDVEFDTEVIRIAARHSGDDLFVITNQLDYYTNSVYVYDEFVSFDPKQTHIDVCIYEDEVHTYDIINKKIDILNIDLCGPREELIFQLSTISNIDENINLSLDMLNFLLNEIKLKHAIYFDLEFIKTYQESAIASLQKFFKI